MKTEILESETDGLLAPDLLPKTGRPFRVTEMGFLTSDRPSPPDETATRDFGDFNTCFKVINVLIVGDCDNELIPRLAELEPKRYIPLHHRVETRADFLAALKSRAWDVVISDHVLPQFSGPEALKLLRNQGSDIPFITVSGVFGKEKAATMIQAGANDYLLKENLARLVPVLQRELKAAQNRHRRQCAERAVTLCGDKVAPELEPPPTRSGDDNAVKP